MFGRKWLAIELVCQQRPLLSQPGYRQVLDVTLRAPTCVSAVIGTIGPQISRDGINTALFQYSAQIGAGPAHIRDRACRNCWVVRKAGAFDEGLDLDLWKARELVKRQLDWARDKSADVEAPILTVDMRNAKMREHE